MKCVIRAADRLDMEAICCKIMTIIKRGGLFASLLITTALWSERIYAEAPQLIVQMRSGQTAGTLIDGQLLAQGTVVYSGVHNGFRVWSDAAMNGSPQRYTLTGTGSSKNQINIRLTGRNWVPDANKGRGIILRDTGYSATFAIEVDGTQTLPVDTWPLQLRAVALVP